MGAKCCDFNAPGGRARFGSPLVARRWTSPSSGNIAMTFRKRVTPQKVVLVSRQWFAGVEVFPHPLPLIEGEVEGKEVSNQSNPSLGESE